MRDGTYNFIGMEHIIFKYPGQIIAGIATRKPDGTLNHEAFILCNHVPKKGATLLDRQVAEVLTDEASLKYLARRATVEKMEAVSVLGNRE